MRLVIDLDDTISVHYNRDFEHARPVMETIEKIRQMKQDGWEIVVYSARGQNSCKGDLALIEQRNREQVERWLRGHKVPFDELRFGKPLGDVYVDDKGISLQDFYAQDFSKQQGNSGLPVYRAGDRILKQCKDAQGMADWYSLARKIGLSVPKVNSVVVDRIDIEYIDGESGYSRDLSIGDLGKIISKIMLMSLYREGAECDVDAIADLIEERAEEPAARRAAGPLMKWLSRYGHVLAGAASFCHGDMTLSNTIFKGDDVYLIDPSDKRNMSSYLVDFGKLLFSIDGGERLLHGTARNYWLHKEELSKVLKMNGWLEAATAMECFHWVRMLKYFPNEHENIINTIADVARRLE